MSLLTRDVSCREAVELVTDYLEGALSTRERRRLERHLAKCDGCSGYLEQIRDVVRATGAVGPEDLDPETLGGLVDLRALQGLGRVTIVTWLADREDEAKGLDDGDQPGLARDDFVLPADDSGLGHGTLAYLAANSLGPQPVGARADVTGEAPTGGLGWGSAAGRPSGPGATRTSGCVRRWPGWWARSRTRSSS